MEQDLHRVNMNSAKSRKCRIAIL